MTLVVLAAELTTFEEASVVGFDTEMCKITECRNKDIVRLEIDPDLYKIKPLTRIGVIISSNPM